MDANKLNSHVWEWQQRQSFDPQPFHCQMPFSEPAAYFHSRYFADMNANPFWRRFLPHTMETAVYFAQKTSENQIKARINLGRSKM